MSEGDSLISDLGIPHDGSYFAMTFRHNQTRYEIVIDNVKSVTNGVRKLRLDNSFQKHNSISLVLDDKTHRMRIVMG